LEKELVLEDFALLDEMDTFLDFGRSRMPSRGNPVFDAFGTEDIETINTPQFPMVCIS
jgi:hypothetical protein